MKGLPFVLLFTAMTFIAWGAYGPVLHHGTDSMGRDSLRAFVGVGIAYFVIAVLVPIYILRTQGENGKWTMLGTFYSLIAGGVGAIGALGVILALAYGGKTIYVMPLVFGFAPIVNTLVTAWLSKTFDQISPVFISGIVVAALGAGGVIIFKPTAPAHAQHAPTDSQHEGDSKPDTIERPRQTPEARLKKDQQKNSAKPPARAGYFVTTLVPQQPASLAAQADDSLPPVVIQPPAPGRLTPTQKPFPATATPTTEAKSESEPVAEFASETAQQGTPQIPASTDDLPPVVVQPPAPASQPVGQDVGPSTPATPPAIPVTEQPPTADLPEELPPVVVQPEALKIAPAPPRTEVASPVEPSKPTEGKPASPLAAEKPSVPEATSPTEKTAEAAPAAVAKAEVEKLPEQADKSQTTAPVTKATEPVPSAPEQIAEVVPPLPTKKTPPSNPSKSSETVPTLAAATAKTAPAADVPMIIVSIIVAALCWGSYGPMLHQGQSRMGGSRLRPFTCVGLAYFFIAVAAPLALISNRAVDTGSWSTAGLSWSIAAGAAGAIGALGVILAFNAGGKPYYVMPLVFGFAPVINTFISLTEAGTWNLVQPMFWVSLAVVIAGAITVLINAPKPQHGKPQAASQPAPAASQ